MNLELLWAKIDTFPGKETGSGASETEIANVEAVVGARIRGSYREFLKRYGWARFHHINVLGIGAALKPHLQVAVVTQWEREDVFPPLPRHLLPIMADGGGNHYCVELDTETSDSKILFWDHETGEASDFAIPEFAPWLSRRLDDLLAPPPSNRDWMDG